MRLQRAIVDGRRAAFDARSSAKPSWLGWHAACPAVVIGLILSAAAWCRAQTDAPPWYEDRANLLVFHDDQGGLQPVRSPEDWSRRAAHIRASMEQAMGPLPAAATIPLDLQVDAETRLRHYVRQHVTFAVEPGDRLSGWLLVPDGAGSDTRRPAMICLPGSAAAGKDIPAGLTTVTDRAYAHELAMRGYVCLVLDYPLLHTAEYRTDPYALGYASATMKGIVNHRRGVDLLQSLPFVDGQAIGVIGHSLGGHNALFLGVFDPRIKAIVSSCGFNVFAKHAGGDIRAWSSRWYMPRIKTVYHDDPAKIPFDFTEVLAVLAPRPVFVNAPLHDAPDFEVSGVQDCIVAARPVYREVFQAADRLVVRHPDAGHAFPAAERQAAYAFLDRYLWPRDEQVDLRRDLVGHWPTLQTPRDIAADESPRHGTGPFTLAMWAQSDEVSDRLPGDLISQYSPAQRRGFHLTLKSNLGATTTQANWRHLQFSIDDNRISAWRDCGRPGKATLAFALAVHDGELYAGTCEPDEGDAGHVYRYCPGAGRERARLQKTAATAGSPPVGDSSAAVTDKPDGDGDWIDGDWIDCGAPDGSNSVTALAVYEGRLYAGTGKYRLAGSALTESPNTTLGGRVFRYEGGARWTDCGQLPDTEAVGGLVVFRGQLYASSLYRPAGFFRYLGESRWASLPVPQGPDRTTGDPGPRRVEALTVFDGFLYASSYDGGHVYRWDGQAWTDCGQLGDNTQTYSFVAYGGRLYVGTWPSGSVYRRDEPDGWTNVGRLGEEREVMGMVAYNGRLLAGTLPLAEVYAYEGGDVWKRLTRLDHTPDVTYRRAWTVAEHDGQAFYSTLPSGKVFACSVGQQVSWGHTLSSAWHHVVATKSADRLTLYVDGERVAQSPAFDAASYQLDTTAPLRIGNGVNGPWSGRLSDVRVYRRVLTAAEIEALAGQHPAP